MPIAAASSTAGCATTHGLDLGRTEALARDLDRVVGAAVQEPLAVVGHAREVAVPPHVRASATSTSRGSARGRCHKPRVMPGHGFVHTSSPTSPRTGWPSSSNTSTAMPSAGPPSEHGDSGCTTCGDRKHAPTSVPPEMLMTGHRPPPTTSKYHRHGASFHGSPVDASTRSDDRSCASDRARRRAPSARARASARRRGSSTRWRSTIDHSRSGPGWSGAPS